MDFFSGIRYNFKGLQFGLKTPSLLMLGLARLIIILVLTLTAVSLIVTHYEQITHIIWNRPESAWLVWLWYGLSWILALLLSGICAVIAFLVAQLLFNVMIMDYMSRITERKRIGQEITPPQMPWQTYFFHLIKQELPRMTLPVLISMGLLVIGWLTPLSPILTFISPMVAGLFIAWDNTDLVPARRLVPFRQRFQFLRQRILFHLGFGLCFLIPGLNILLLSFAPVGATLYYVEQFDFKSLSRD
jgi:CysZ protein